MPSSFCVLLSVLCGQWSALVSCWQALGRSLWACCPSPPYHRSIDLLLQVPTSASVSAFFMSLPVSLPSCLHLLLCQTSVSHFTFTFVFWLLSSLVCLPGFLVYLPVLLLFSLYSLSESDFLSVNLCLCLHPHPCLYLSAWFFVWVWFVDCFACSCPRWWPSVCLHLFCVWVSDKEGWASSEISK